MIMEMIKDIKEFDYSNEDEQCSYEACENPKFKVIGDDYGSLRPVLTKEGEKIHDQTSYDIQYFGYSRDEYLQYINSNKDEQLDSIARAIISQTDYDKH